MTALVRTILACSFGLLSSSAVVAQGDSLLRKPLSAALEARLVLDSAGCPGAVDIWLSMTSDTIQGIEVALQWDHPGPVVFMSGGPSPDTSIADSVADLLLPKDKSTLIPLDRRGSLIANWELVQARTTSGHVAKLIAVAKVMSQESIAPVVPGQSGLLVRLPLAVRTLPPGAPTPDTVLLTFEMSQTRLSTHRGVLFDRVSVAPVSVDISSCRPTRGGPSDRKPK